MRRPVTAVAASEAAGIAAAYYIHLNLKHLCILCIGACFVVQLVYKLEKRGRFGLSKGSRAGLLLCCTIAFMLGAILMNRAEGFESPLLAAAEESPGTASEVRGVPVSVTAKNGYFSLIVKTSDKISGRAEKVLVKLETAEEDTERVFAMAGRSCVFSGPAEAPDGRRNFGCFDYMLYLKSRGIRSICTVSRYRAAAGPVVNPYLNFLSVRKGQFYVSARKYMEESRFSLLAALLFGDKGYMDEGVYEEFQSNGIAHVLAVSGLHVSMVYGLLLKLLDNRRNIYTSSVIAFSLVCYICLANFSVSVLRAAFMIFLRLIAFHIKRRYDLVSAAAAACLVFMTANPYSIFDSGFQLSYMAAFSMGVILPWMELKATELADKHKKGWIKDISDVLSPCIAVQIGMTPLILFHFLVMSPVSFILNPFAVFTAGILMPAGLIFFALDAAGIGIISAAAAGPAAFFAGVLLQINRIGSMLGGSWSFPAPPLGVIAVYYGFVFFFFSEARYMMRRMGRRAALNSICLALAVTAVLVPKYLKLSDGKYPWQYDSRIVTFLDVGQGDCTHISSDGFNILVDGGGNRFINIAKRTIKPYLLKSGVSGIELAIVTHPDSDHALGIQQLSQLMDIDTIAFSCAFESNSELLDGYRANHYIFLGRGDKIPAGKGSLEVLWPVKGAAPKDNDNDNSLVCLYELDGFKLLLTGDITSEVELEMLKFQGFEGIDILKLAHHGSAYSSCEEFVSAVNPSAAIISCRRNNSYGHPAPRVMDLLSEQSIDALRVDQNGAAGIKKTPDGFTYVNADGSCRTDF